MNNKEALNLILGKKWIILHERGAMIPILTAGSLFDVFSWALRESVGKGYHWLIMAYKNGKTYALFPKREFEDVGLFALEKLKRNPGIIKNHRKKFLEKANKFVEQMKKRSKNYSGNISDKYVIDEYNFYFNNYFDSCLWGEPFPFAVNHELSKHLKDLLKNKIPERNFLDAFTILVSPIGPSFINREEIELIRIAKSIAQNKVYAALFKNNASLIIKELKNYPKLDGAIKRHQKLYFWVAYDYLGNVWDLKYFIIRIKKMLELEAENKLTNKLEIYYKNLRKEQKKIFGNLIKGKIISKKDKRMFIAAQESALLMDLKKEKLSQAHYYINKLLEAAANKRKSRLNEIAFLVWDELKDYLDGNFDIREIKKRCRASAYLFYENGRNVFTGEDAHLILKHVRSKSHRIFEISGIAASPGNYRGLARVVMSSKECNKLKKREILVTGMTTPEYVVAMKKAAAIITNEGGVTSHAAIVSRELGIPCIVGTKTATRNIKTGDLLEIHGASGVIKILRKWITRK